MAAEGTARRPARRARGGSRCSRGAEGLKGCRDAVPEHMPAPRAPSTRRAACARSRSSRPRRRCSALDDGAVLLVIATDPGIAIDMPMWCKATRNEHLGTFQDGAAWKSFVRKRARVSEGRHMKRQGKAIALISGGLDSTLALALVRRQGIEVKAVNFYTGFCITETQRRKGGRADGTIPQNEALRAAADLEVDIEYVDISGSGYLDMLVNPKLRATARTRTRASTAASS